MSQPVMKITLRCNAAPIEAAMASLVELSKRAPELVLAFLNGVDSATELVRIEPDELSAPRAGECLTVLYPSDELAEFLAAARTGEVDGL
ncbi:MAG TPA: hypothetical protein VF389_10080 [Woeseiaceae bacterium]